MMPELIVVGMRYHTAYAKLKPTIGSRVYLIPEPTNHMNSLAVAVYFPSEGETCGGHNKIGYIRDADLHKTKGVRDTRFVEYEVDRIYPNYLRLVEPKKKAAAWPFPSKNREEYTTSMVGEWATGCSDVKMDYGKNPCAEIMQPYTSKTYEDILNNGDAFIATERNPRDAANERAKEFYSDCKTDAEKDAKIDKYAKIYGANQTEKNKMNFNTNSMRNSFFREVNNVAMDMQTGKLGVVTAEGIIIATDDGVSVNPITEMGFKIPAFAMRVPVAELAKGDIIIGAGEPVFFMEGSKVGYMTVSTSGVIQETGSVANMFFGKNTVMAVKNMFGSSEGKEGSMNPMFMLAMMGDDAKGSNFGFKEMMMMQMMSGGKGMGEMNPMFMMMLMSKDK